MTRTVTEGLRPLARLLGAYLLAVVLVAPIPAVAANYRLLMLGGLHLKWGAAEMGSGAAVTYGFATARQSFPDAINCRKLAPMTDLAVAWGSDPARLAALAAEAFAIWSREADVRFRPARPGEVPDILIGAQGEAKRIAFANVWHAPGVGGIAPLTRATICFNPRLAWSTAEDAPVHALDLQTVLAHEIGHTIASTTPERPGR